MRSTHAPVCLLYHPASGTSGEDQAPSQPLGRLSEPIQGLQHVNAVLLWLEKESTAERSPPCHTRIYARKRLYSRAQCEVHRRKSPSPLLYFLPRLLWQRSMHVRNLVEKTKISHCSNRRTGNWLHWICACEVVLVCVCVCVRAPAGLPSYLLNPLQL